MGKKSLFGALSLGLASIDFQTDGFGKDIEEQLTIIREKYKKPEELFDCKEKKVLDSIIYKRTGLMVGIEFNTDITAAVDVPTINKNHVLINNAFRGDYHSSTAIGLLEKIKKNKLVNIINLKKAKVSGIFSELPSIILVSGKEFMKKKLSVAEYTAVILHEIGHIFVSYEFINRTSTTNQVLAAVCRSVQDKDDFKTKEIIFKEASELVKGKGEAITSLVNERDLTVISTVIIKSGIEDAISENGMSEYDATSFEQLADNFSARFGYARDLITGLDKLHKDSFLSAETSRVSYFIIFLIQSFILFIQLARIALLFILGGTILAAGAYGILLLNVFLSLLFLASFSFMGAKNKDYTYDTLKVRHLRIKEQLVERIKNKNLSKKEVQSILEGIEASEKVIKETYIYAGPLEILSNFVFSSNSDVKTGIDLQRELETLSSNDFFIKSATLQTLSV